MHRAALPFAACVLVAACATGDNTPDATPDNFVANGTFDSAPHYWTAENSVLTVTDGRLRITTEEGTGPGLAYQRLNIPTGVRYRISVAFHDRSFVSSPQLRVGRGVDFDTNVQLIEGTTSADFTATDSPVYVTLNNAGPASGDYAEFDDVKLSLLFPTQ